MSEPIPAIAILAGTNRPGSNTLHLAREVESLYRELGESPTLLDLQRIPAEALLGTAYRRRPPALEPLVQGVLQARGLVVVVPEYNGGFPGVLKLFIDLLPFPESFEGRPVCFVGLAAGQFGALRPVEQLQQVFGYRNALLYPKRVFLPGIAQVLDEAGRIREEAVRTRLRQQAEGFLDFVRRLRG